MKLLTQKKIIWEKITICVTIIEYLQTDLYFTTLKKNYSFISLKKIDNFLPEIFVSLIFSKKKHKYNCNYLYQLNISIILIINVTEIMIANFQISNKQAFKPRKINV